MKAGQNHLSSTLASSKKSTLASSVGRHSIKSKAGEEKIVGINLIFLQTGTANKLLQLMKEGKLLDEEEEEVVEEKGEVKSRQKGKPRVSPKTAISINTSQEEEEGEEGDSDCSEVNSIIAMHCQPNHCRPHR